MANTKRIRPGNGGGGLLYLLLGIFMGIIFVVGGVAAAGYYVYKKPIGQTVQKVDSIIGADLYNTLFGSEGKDGYLNSDYANQTISELVGTVKEVASGVTDDDGKLGALEVAFPALGEKIDEFLKPITEDYGIPLTKDDLMETPIKELSKTLEGKLKDTPLSGLLGLNETQTDENGNELEKDPILMALCYGEKGVDYTLDAEGNVVMLGDSKEATIKTLTEGTGLSDTINKLSVSSLLKDLDPDDPIMRTLAYGPATHYDPVYNADGTKIVDVTMKKVTYVWKEVNAGEGEKLYDVDGNLVNTYDMTALTVTLEDGTVQYLAPVSSLALLSVTPVEYYAYTTEAKTEHVYYQKTKILDLTTDASSLIDGLYLGEALNINNSSHKVLISLAYGSEDNYTILPDGSIEPKDGYTPRTLGELKNDNADIINEIRLGDALNVTPSSHSILIALAYGREGIDYEVVDTAEGKKIQPKDGGTPPKDIGDLTEDSENLINGIYLKDALSVDANAHKILISLAYGTEGVDYHIVDTPDGKVIERLPDGAEPRTIAALTKNSESLINGIALTDVMAPDTDSTLIMYLLYGKKGVHYEVSASNEVVSLQKRIAILGSQAYNEYGEIISGSLNLSAGTYTEGETVYKFDLSTQIGTVHTAAGDAPVYYLTDEEGNAVHYSATTLGDLSSENNMISKLTHRLTLDEIIEGNLSTNKILAPLKDETIETLPDAIAALTIMDVYEDDIFETKMIDGEEKTVVNGTWWYLLHDKTHCAHADNINNCIGEKGSPCITDPQISELTDLINTMQENIRTVSLRKLSNDGILSGISKETLDMDIVTQVKLGENPLTGDPLFVMNFPNPTGKTKLGDLTITEMLTYVENVLNVISSLAA